ncbi:MAG: GxxExxY protein [Planctomycetes bacterium]|nr:GxxExxY protein [Planctomycetota bacterium]
MIACAFKIANPLGCGFSEKVYENALVHELRKTGLVVRQREPITVFYDGVVVGDFFADLIIENSVVIELKATRELSDVFTAQRLNDLKATSLPLCWLINFGRTKIENKRFRL